MNKTAPDAPAAMTPEEVAAGAQRAGCAPPGSADSHEAHPPDEPRRKILTSFSEWTALSALRSGAPIKSRKDVYGLIAQIQFATVIDASRGRIDTAEFDVWHRAELTRIVRAHPKMTGQWGWAAKIVNVYLKTYCYVGDGGREGILSCLHPPIDGGLWRGIEAHFGEEEAVLADTHGVAAISAINSYESYERILKGLRAAAARLRCPLIEVEQLWQNT